MLDLKFRASFDPDLLDPVSATLLSLSFSKPMPHTVTLPNGEILTGRSWRNDNALFLSLPFTTNVVQAADDMGDALTASLDPAGDSPLKLALIVCQKRFLPDFMI